MKSVLSYASHIVCILQKVCAPLALSDCRGPLYQEALFSFSAHKHGEILKVSQKYFIFWQQEIQVVTANRSYAVSFRKRPLMGVMLSIGIVKKRSPLVSLSINYFTN